MRGFLLLEVTERILGKKGLFIFLRLIYLFFHIYGYSYVYY